jgi:putative endonuclease
MIEYLMTQKDNEQEQNTMVKLGEFGEQLVSLWLEGQEWTILQRQWRSHWGEIDIIAKKDNIMIFVEVKTRSQNNWDLNGLLAINQKKQSKLIETAQYFLEEFPHFNDYSLRFDVALVKSQKLFKPSIDQSLLPDKIEFNQPVFYQGYQLTLIQYLESAFMESQ